jgi:ABC-type transport system substrate-binding protein
MTFQRNPAYWRKDTSGNVLPYLKTINAQFIPDATVQTATMESGQADMLSRTPALDSPRLNKDSNYQSTRYVGAVTGMFYINHALPPMDNVNFRRAFASALDVPNYIKNYLLGVEPVAKGLLTPASWAYDDAIQGYPYDLAKAKQYLVASGLPQSQWTVVGGFVPPTEAGQFWEASLKGAGITLKWNAVPAGGVNRHLFLNQGDDPIIQATNSTWSLRVDPDGSIGQFYTQKAAYNSGAGAVPEIESLVQQARQTYDQAQRKQMYFDIQAKAVDMVYSCIPTYYGINEASAVKAVGNLAALYGGEGKPRYANLWI